MLSSGRGLAMHEGQEASIGIPDDGSLKVVVWHPSTMFVDALAELLALEGLEIIGVTTADELMTASCRADACLVDVRMEGAVDAIERLAWCPVRIVAYIDGSEPRQLTAVLEAGAAAWVSAGDGFDRLVRVLRSDRPWGKNDRELAERHVLRNLHQERASSGLTTRELDVLLGLVEGRATKDLAQSLHVSAATVRTHVHNVMAKLGVHTRLQAVAVAIEADLVRLSEDPEDPAQPAVAGSAPCRRH
jgi:two-component system nitrate/nitrite response regulator NarL